MAAYAASPQETYRSAAAAPQDATDPHCVVSALAVYHGACKFSLSTLVKRQPSWTLVISKQHYCRSQVGDYAFLRHSRNTSKNGKWE